MRGELPANWREHAAKARRRRSRPRARRWRRARRRSSRSKRSRRRCPSSSAARPTSRARTTRCTSISKPLTPADARGNYLYYGVREFGMAAMMNGQAAHGGVIPYGGTFLVFSDYARNALAHGGADRPAQHLRADARLDRARRGRPDAPADRASREPAPDAEHGALAAVRYRRDGRRLGRGDRAERRARRASCSRARICRTCRARPSRSRRSRAAATSSATATRRRRSR